MSLSRLRAPLSNLYGPVAFYKQANKILQQRPLTWAVWDQFFALAEEHIMVTYVDRTGTECMAYPEIAPALSKSYKRAQQARTAGLTPWQWQQAEDRKDMLEKEALMRKNMPQGPFVRRAAV